MGTAPCESPKRSWKNKVDNMKKLLKTATAFLLILAVAAGLCACSGGAGGKAPGKKIAIVTATLSQNPEEYRRAAQLASKYSYVEHVVYTDTRIGTSGILDFYKRVNDVAADESYGAIVIARANLGAVAAVRAAKAKNPDKIIVCTAPVENIETLAKSADAILAIDTAKDAAMMVEEAHGRGAEVFVYYATGVQQSTLNVRESREAAKQKCDELGMTYKFVNCYDVTQTLGIKGAQSFMKEDIARQLKNFEGKKIAAYCADISSQAELIKNVCPNGIIVAGTSFPSVYDGYTAAFNIEMGKKWDDKSKVFSKVRAAIRENGGTKNQFIVWDDLTAVSMTDAAFEYARASLTGEQADMAKAVKSSFPSKIKVSDKKLDKCTFIYTEDYRVL